MTERTPEESLAVAGWQAVTVSLPDMDEPVWLYEAGRGMWIGARGDVGDDEWLWGNTYGSHYWDGERWKCSDNEVDDDYQPTHWRPLPLPPGRDPR